MIRKIEDYIEIVGDNIVADLHKKARKLYNKHIIQLNSTFIGGGVAEILNSVVPIMNDTGVDTGWRVLHGNSTFYDITKKFHNSLQSADIEITDEEKKFYVEVNEEFASYTHIHHDCVIVHDPQPLPFIHFFKKRQPWIWRCHIDITEPNKKVWNFLKNFMLRYDVIIVSGDFYKKDSLPVEQRVISPAIDPLSIKNRDMSDNDIAHYIKAADIPTDKPIITQVSRMDKWKDPVGVLEVYNYVKKKIDCRLIFCYNLASDDPEGMEIYTRILNNAKDLIAKGEVLFIMGNNDFLVNAIQRISSVIIQKSTKEGFCLSVTEALWKGTPVVASSVGGIPTQITDGESGFLVDPYDYQGFADRIVTILKNKKLADKFRKNGKEFIKNNFLITRLMGNYFDLIYELIS